MMHISSNNGNIKTGESASGKGLSGTHHGGVRRDDSMKELLLTHQMSEVSSSSAPSGSLTLEESTAAEPLWGENIRDDGDDQSLQKQSSGHEHGHDHKAVTNDGNRNEDGSQRDSERIGRSQSRSGLSRSGRSHSSRSRRSQRQSTHQSASEYTSTTTSVAEEFSTSRSTVSFAFFDDLDNEEDTAESAVPGVACASSSSTNGGGSRSRRLSHSESPGRVDFSDRSGSETFSDIGDSTVGERCDYEEFNDEYNHQHNFSGHVEEGEDELDVLSNLTVRQIRVLAHRMHQSFLDQDLIQDRRYHLKTYQNCFLHDDAMQWLADQVIELEQAEERKRQKQHKNASMEVRRSRISGARSVVSAAAAVNSTMYGQAILTKRRMSYGDVVDEEGTLVSMGTTRTDAATTLPSLRSNRTPPPSLIAGSARAKSSFALMQNYFDSIQEKAAQLGNFMIQGGYVAHVCNDHKFCAENKGRTLFFEFLLRDPDGASHDGSSRHSNQSSSLSAVAANLLSMRLIGGHKNKDKSSSPKASHSSRNRSRGGVTRNEVAGYDEAEIPLTGSSSLQSLSNQRSSSASVRTSSTFPHTGVGDGLSESQPKTTKRRTIDKALLSLVRDMHTDFRHTKRIEDRMWHLKVYKQCMLHDDVMKWMTEEVQIHYQARSYDESAPQHHSDRSSKKHEKSQMPASLSQRQAEEAAAMLANAMIQHGYLSHVCRDSGHTFQAHSRAYLFFRFHSSVIGNDLHLSNLALLDEKGVDQLQGQLFEEVTLAVLSSRKRKGKNRKN